MTLHSLVCTKLLTTNAHLGRRVAHHFNKVYLCGSGSSRNGIAIFFLDSDKTRICLRNAFHFIGSPIRPIRQKGRSFFLKTNHRSETIMEVGATEGRINMILNGGSGGLLTHSFSSSPQKGIRSKSINLLGSNQPDCVVILDADRKRKSSVILEADRSQIPIASLVYSKKIPLGGRITYPIPANDPIQFIYLFRHSITKTVIRG